MRLVSIRDDSAETEISFSSILDKFIKIHYLAHAAVIIKEMDNYNNQYFLEVVKLLPILKQRLEEQEDIDPNIANC